MKVIYFTAIQYSLKCCTEDQAVHGAMMGGRGRLKGLVIGFFKNIDATLNELDASDLDCMTGFYFNIDIVAK